MRCRSRVWCWHSREIEVLTRLCPHLRRVDQAVAANPYAVVDRRQVGNDVTALFVGDDDLGKFGWKIDALSNDPYTSFGPVRTADNAADIVAIDCRLVGLLRGRSRRPVG